MTLHASGNDRAIWTNSIIYNAYLITHRIQSEFTALHSNPLLEYSLSLTRAEISWPRRYITFSVSLFKSRKVKPTTGVIGDQKTDGGNGKKKDENGRDYLEAA